MLVPSSGVAAVATLTIGGDLAGGRSGEPVRGGGSAPLDKRLECWLAPAWAVLWRCCAAAATESTVVFIWSKRGFVA